MADKALGWKGETFGRTVRRMAERRTCFVSAHGNGGWRVEAGGTRRVTHVRKTKGQAVVTGKELARSRAPCLKAKRHTAERADL